MATAKQIEANRRNARKSTGPKSDAGKARSRANALKHGLCGAGLALPEGQAEAVAERMAQWHSALRPFDAYQTWLLEVIAVESVRVDRCRAREAALRDEAARRAGESWDEDRRREAEEVASWRGSNPGLACARLRATGAGCRLLRDWWRALGRALGDGGWDAAQEALALDLLGVPAALRAGAASPLEATGGGDRAALRRAIVAAEVDRLERLLAEVMPARDGREREAAALGLPADEGPELARLRRYEGACLRRLRWARAQLRAPGAIPLAVPRPVEGRSTPPGSRPAAVPAPGVPATTPESRAADPWRAPGDETNPIPGPGAGREIDLAKLSSGMKPRLAYQVDNTLQADGSKHNVELRFDDMDDFEPEQVVNRDEPLKKLLAARKRLTDLVSKIDGNDKLEALLQDVVNNTDSLKTLSVETGRDDRAGLGPAGDRRPPAGAAASPEAILARGGRCPSSVGVPRHPFTAGPPGPPTRADPRSPRKRNRLTH